MSALQRFERAVRTDGSISADKGGDCGEGEEGGGQVGFEFRE